MNESSENVESGVEPGAETSEGQTVESEGHTVEVIEIDYSDRLDNIYEVQCYQFGLISCFVGLFLAYMILNFISRHF